MTNLINKKLLFLAIIIVSYSALLCEKLVFKIEYVGISVADVEFERTNNNLNIKAQSGSLANFFSISFDNRYNIVFDDEFKPKEYTKTIKQKNFLENSINIYNYDTLKAEYFCSASDIYLHYPIKFNTRDFFSGLYYLRETALDNSFFIDAAGIIWEVQSEVLNTEIIKTKLGKKNVKKVKISFTQADPEKNNLNTQKLKSDILTNNLVNEDNVLFFWFTDDEKKIPIKAQYTMSPFNVNWTIIKIEN